MHKLTPDWESIAATLVSKLDEVADEIDFSLEEGADPAATVLSAVDELKLFIGAIDDDPALLSAGDAS